VARSLFGIVLNHSADYFLLHHTHSADHEGWDNYPNNGATLVIEKFNVTNHSMCIDGLEMNRMGRAKEHEALPGLQ
jgi:hypothetical protein